MKKRFGAGKSYADILTILIVIIIIAVIALLGFFTVRAVNKKKVETVASDSSEKFLEKAEDNKKKIEQIKNQTKNSNTTNETIDVGEILGQVGSMTDESAEANNSSEIPENKVNIKKEYMGNYEIKGTINIPKTNCNYPILNKVTIDSLNKAVAIQEIVGNPELKEVVKDLNVKGTNAFILGHNYKNGQFFSDNEKLVEGDKILITDQYKETVTYTIYKIFRTTPDDASFMLRDIDINSREITLQTCNEDATERLIIQAREETK